MTGPQAPVEAVRSALRALDDIDLDVAARECPTLAGMPARLLAPSWLSGARLVTRGLRDVEAQCAWREDDPLGAVPHDARRAATSAVAGEERTALVTRSACDRAAALGAAYAAELVCRKVAAHA